MLLPYFHREGRAEMQPTTLSASAWPQLGTRARACRRGKDAVRQVRRAWWVKTQNMIKNSKTLRREFRFYRGCVPGPGLRNVGFARLAADFSSCCSISRLHCSPTFLCCLRRLIPHAAASHPYQMSFVRTSLCARLPLWAHPPWITLNDIWILDFLCR